MIYPKQNCMHISWTLLQSEVTFYGIIKYVHFGRQLYRIRPEGILWQQHWTGIIRLMWLFVTTNKVFLLEHRVDFVDVNLKWGVGWWIKPCCAVKWVGSKVSSIWNCQHHHQRVFINIQYISWGSWIIWDHERVIKFNGLSWTVRSM